MARNTAFCPAKVCGRCHTVQIALCIVSKDRVQIAECTPQNSIYKNLDEIGE